MPYSTAFGHHSAKNQSAMTPTVLHSAHTGYWHGGWVNTAIWHVVVEHSTEINL